MTEQWPAPTGQPEELAGGPRTPQRLVGRRREFAVGAAAMAGGLVLGAMGIAGAASDGAPTVRAASLAQAATPSEPPAPPAPASPSTDAEHGPGMPPLPHHGGGRRGHGPKGFGRGALHGEFVTDKPGGGYQTVQMQRGTATAVSATSITVKSADGFTRSYAVNAETLVNAGRDGITSVAVNDVVHVHAIGAGEGAAAAHVVDESKMAAGRQRFGGKPGKDLPGLEAPAPSASPASA